MVSAGSFATEQVCPLLESFCRAANRRRGKCANSRPISLKWDVCTVQICHNVGSVVTRPNNARRFLLPTRVASPTGYVTLPSGRRVRYRACPLRISPPPIKLELLALLLRLLLWPLDSHTLHRLLACGRLF